MKETNLMTETIWSSKFVIGIRDIDEQHYNFIKLVEEAINKYKLNPHLQSGKSIELISVLEDYIKLHFSFEEELMRKSNYADIENHIKEHNYFIDKVTEYKLEYDFNSAFLMNKLIIFIKKWFLNHIIKVDVLYKDDVIKSEN